MTFKMTSLSELCHENLAIKFQPWGGQDDSKLESKVG